MTTVHTLASGSAGNAVLLCCEDTRLLLDAGISCRRIVTALGELDLEPADLTAILITHTHSDHIAGLQTLLKRRDCPPICASQAAARDLLYRLPACGGQLRAFAENSRFRLGSCAVTAFSTAHDAPGSCGYRVDTPDGSFGLLTDTGCITPQAAEVLPGVDLAVLEANHDPETLRSGPYPESLKRRILGRSGHLSNEDAARFAVSLVQSGAEEVVLAHLSRENNTPAMAHSAVSLALSAAGLAPALSVAPRDHLGPVHCLTRKHACRK